MSVKHLSEDRDVDDFFSKLKKSDIIIYHPSYSAQQVCSLGRKYKWIVEYCHPETTYYQKHGSYTCKVIDKISHNQRIIDPIDVAMIATNFEGSWVNEKALKNFK